MTRGLLHDETHDGFDFAQVYHHCSTQQGKVNWQQGIVSIPVWHGSESDRLDPSLMLWQSMPRGG